MCRPVYRAQDATWSEIYPLLSPVQSCCPSATRSWRSWPWCESGLLGEPCPGHLERQEIHLTQVVTNHRCGKPLLRVTDFLPLRPQIMNFTDQGCQVAIAKILDWMRLSFGLDGLWLRYAKLQNLISSFTWIAPSLHPGAIQGKDGNKFCHLATLLHSPSDESVPFPLRISVLLHAGDGLGHAIRPWEMRWNGLIIGFENGRTVTHIWQWRLDFEISVIGLVIFMFPHIQRWAKRWTCFAKQQSGRRKFLPT